MVPNKHHNVLLPISAPLHAYHIFPSYQYRGCGFKFMGVGNIQGAVVFIRVGVDNHLQYFTIASEIGFRDQLILGDVTGNTRTINHVFFQYSEV